MSLLGLPAMRFLDSTDRDERLLLLGVAQEGFRLLEIVQRNQAIHNANAAAKAQR
jgi:hypothetical protein